MRLQVPVPVRWGDLDAYGHVNNVALLRLLEEARISAFWHHPGAEDPWPTAVLRAGPRATTHTLVARTEIEYLAPVPYRRDPAEIQMWVGRLGGASLDVCYEVVLPEDGTPAGVCARAVTTLVLVDAGTGRPRRLTPQEREVWGRYSEEPPRMRRRP